MDERLRFWTDSILRSYSKIFFSESRLFGTMIIASTFVVPSHGILGLSAAIFSNLTAYVLGLERTTIRKGLYGFNGVLTGLGIGFFYEISPQLFFIIVITSIIVVLLMVFLNNTMTYYLGLPPMSIPFTLVTWLVIMASAEFGYFNLTYERWGLFQKTISYLSDGVNTFLSSIGAVLFQINTVSGIVILIGLIIYSRIAAVLVTIGYIAGLLIHNFLGINTSLINTQYLGFNYMLAALAIGGIFIIPGPGSVFLSVVTVAIAIIILTALQSIFPAFLSPLAMPFNLSVLLVLYVIKSRYYPSMGVTLVTGEVSVPEDNLSRYRENIRTQRHSGIDITLPFNGKWKITQGIDGEYTHKDDWRFAYDFMAVGNDNSTYRNYGARLEDYYSYGLPVLSPADGTVVSIYSNIPDNPVGMVNVEENWGNFIIIEHLQGFYSCTAHLKKDSIKVTEGLKVKKGEVIAECGNSGRSPYPHVHLQFQMQQLTGSPSIYFEFSNISIVRDRGVSFLPRGTLEENSTVQNITSDEVAETFFPYNMTDEYAYEFNGKKETWRLDTDFYGNTFLEASPEQTRLYFRLSEGVLRINKVTGSRSTGLFLVGKYLSEIPLLENQNMRWTSLEGIDYFLNRFFTRILDILSLLGINIAMILNYQMRSNHKEIQLKITTSFCLKLINKVAFQKKVSESVDIVIKKDGGIESLQCKNKRLAQREVRIKSKN